MKKYILITFLLISGILSAQEGIDHLKRSRVSHHEFVKFIKNTIPSSKMNVKTWILLYLPTFRKPESFLSIGYSKLANGDNFIGNKFMEMALSHYKERNDELFHMLSVWNTKNGNYSLGIQYLDSAASYNKETYGYYGWVSLYYYRDYQKALDYLEIYDSLTPNFSDFPVGESILNLKGLAYMNLKEYDKAINEFNTYITNEKNKNGENWVDATSPYYLGICYEKQGKTKEAIESYDLAIKIRPDYSEAFYHKAMLTSDLEVKKQLLNTCLSNIKKGNVMTDVYIELFEKVYIQDVEKSLSSL